MHSFADLIVSRLKPVWAFICFISLFIGIHDASAQIPGVYYYDGKEPIALKGKWHFVPNSFLDFDQVITDTSKLFLNVPGNWNSIDLDTTSFGAKGYGTYYAKINLEANADLSDLAIRIPEVGLAYTIFINDIEVESLGVPSMNPENEEPKIDPQIVEFPPLEGEEVYLIIHISNHNYSYGGLFYPPIFGSEKTIRVNKERYNTIKLLILGSVIILVMYMLYVYSRLEKERFRLYFSIICLVLLLHTLTTGDMPLLDIFPGTNWAFLKKMAFTSFFLIGASNGLFLRELFPKYFNEKIIYGFSIVSLIAVLFTLFVPIGIGALLVTPFQILTVISGIYFFERLIRATYDKAEGSRLLLFGYLLAFLAGINDILSTQYIITTPQMSHFGMFAYILTLTVIMAMKYVNALKKNENITESLSLSNEYLEKNIEDRTKKLQHKNDLIDAKNKELEKALKDQEDLMAVVAHDLKAPFNQIQELSNLLMDEAKLKKDHVTYVDMILKVTDNARVVIENLVFIRSYQSDSFTPEMKSFDPIDFFERKVSTFQSEALKKKISIENAHSIQSKNITSDESALDRIIDNLLSNAIKFSPFESKIAFEMLEENDGFVFRIKDYGQGFSKDDKKNAFKKFQKLSTKPTAGELSTGLGLSIVKTLVDKLGGDIQLYSEKGKGAEFIVKIPKQNKGKAAPVQKSPVV